jgi:hypothetical protein
MLGFWLLYWDFGYILFIAIPFAILGGLAQMHVRSAFQRAGKKPTRSGMSGREVAQAILDANNIHDVRIEPAQGYLSDHYDPRHKVLRLSRDVYQGRNVASAGVAAHEVGHALQHARGYGPLAIRNAIVPTASIGSGFGMMLVMIGVGFGATSYGKIALIAGCALFTMFVVFQLVNLPVEYNASSRARQTLVANGLVSQQEDAEVGRVLNAAALTYVAATVQAVVTLLYFLWRAGIIGGRD